MVIAMSRENEFLRDMDCGFSAPVALSPGTTAGLHGGAMRPCSMIPFVVVAACYDVPMLSRMLRGGIFTWCDRSFAGRFTRGGFSSSLRSCCCRIRLPSKEETDMVAQAVPPRVQWQEITRSLSIASEELFGKLSVRSILSHSWEAGGVYPTLLGYALGAIATAAVLGASHWVLRFVPPVMCLFVFVQTLQSMENTAYAVLLAFAAFIGVGCTYVQVLTWQEAFASVAYRRKVQKSLKSKVTKED